MGKRANFSSAYDIVLEGGDAPEYVAKRLDGTGFFIVQDSTGPFNTEENGNLVTTSKFQVNCSGFISFYNGGILYDAPDPPDPWEVVGNGTNSPGPGDRNNFIEVQPVTAAQTTRSSRKKRANVYSDSNNPRCPKVPPGLTSAVRPDAPAPASNGCGPVGDVQAPNFAFGSCCNTLDVCYGIITLPGKALGPSV